MNWFARTKTPALAFIVIVTSNAAAYPAAPCEDFVAWYRQWLNALPATYEQTFRQHFNHPPDAPLDMASSKWEERDFQLITTDNSDVRKTYRFLTNPSYCATLEGLVGSNGDIVWSVSQFANRSDGNFEQAADARHHIGADPDFLGMRYGRFDGPLRVSGPRRDPARADISNVVISFLGRDSNKRRLPLHMTIAFADSAHGMPIEVRTREIGGAATRVRIGGWRQQDGAWVYNDLRTFYQRAGTPQEVLHNTQSWQFGSKQSQRDKECFLSYYGLPEPNAVTGPWKLVALACALALVAGGRVLRNRSSGT